MKFIVIYEEKGSFFPVSFFPVSLFTVETFISRIFGKYHWIASYIIG